MGRIIISQGDITKIMVDAIVNAANNSLLGGGGVDGAIHRAAGKELYEECLLLNGCETGDAKITKGYKLPAKYVIHTVGPIWQGGVKNEAILLEQCYLRSLTVAKENDVKTIAFPSISTGAYGYPIKEASIIALETTLKFFKKNDLPDTVIFVCYSYEDFLIYLKTYNNIKNLNR